MWDNLLCKTFKHVQRRRKASLDKASIQTLMKHKARRRQLKERHESAGEATFEINQIFWKVLL